MNKVKLSFTLLAMGDKLKTAACMYQADETDIADAEVEGAIVMVRTVMKEQTGIDILSYFGVK